jgi:hypothetical protein
VSQPGIPTEYGGIRFRSRLEARWACFFDAIGWRWEYEPLDFDGWIPDFLLHTRPLSTLVEVKPDVAVEQLHRHVPKIERALGKHACYEVLLLGCTPFPFGETNMGGHDAAGLLGAAGEDENGRPVRTYETAEWITCAQCEGEVFFDSIMAWLCRLCGADGKVYLGPDPAWNVRGAWAHACNETQWRAA